jgi:adenine-specific DNA methylase
MKGSDYIYACFADKDDPEHRYRYAYALEWVEKAKKTKVRLAVTYALRPEARDSSYGKKKSKVSRIIVNGKEYKKRNSDDNADDDRIILDGVKINGMEVARDGIRELIEDGINNGININVDSLLAYREKTPESWLSEFNAYKRLFLKHPDGSTATHYATTIYSLCKKSAMLDRDEKKIVISELAKLKAAAKDELIQNIFEMCVKKLKE